MVTSQITITPYARRHRRDFLRFLQNDQRLHIHLDWQMVDEWISDPEVPVYLAFHERQLVGAIASAPALGHTTWLRLLGLGNAIDADILLAELWAPLRDQLLSIGVTQIATLLLQPWMTPHLTALGFTYLDEIVTLRRQGMDVPLPLRSDVLVRHADWREVRQVVEIDHTAFLPIWQLTETSLRQAARSSYSFTVAELDGRMVGYQISTMYQDGAHLARLAVLPDVQGQGIGGLLIGEMIGQFLRRGVMSVTVNTQQTNVQSQRLYQRYGFSLTGLTMPVWAMDIR